MEPTWILVADEARARLFRVERPRGPLLEEADFVNPEERLPEHELGADEPGRVRGPGGKQHSYGPDAGMRAHEAERFAGELAKHLRQGREQGRFRRLYLAAAPHFLGALRHALDQHTAALVVDSYDKDLVRHTAEDIRGHLPYRL
ncbi:MAG: host attachment protein [Halofilum sp. (in: g-proteobacteria)]|nr:host attachment protein [Halofilum sp. (in: g-proteobacteria)]